MTKRGGLSLSTRMKENYERRNQTFLIRRMPVIMRLDGKAFHTFTRGFEKPFDALFSTNMVEGTKVLCMEIQGAKCGYVQSDEISILITDFDKLDTDAWFGNNVQKMVSVAASKISVFFSKYYSQEVLFDCRVFNIPKEEVNNYFVWRQQDWIRNSVQMLAGAHYSHKQLHCKNQPEMHEMLHNKGINWAHLEDKWKNGVFIQKSITDFWEAESECPIFTKDTQVVERFLEPLET